MIDSTTRMPVTVWMNMPSPYQADFFRELNRREDVSLNVVFAQEMEPMRTELGWKASGDGFSSLVLAKRFRLLHVTKLAWQNRDRINIVNGVWALPPFILAAGILTLLGSTIFYHAETCDPRAPRSRIRLTVRNALGAIALRGARGVFAISTMAERLYAELGSNKTRVFPFGYFKAHRLSQIGQTAKPAFEVLFVGQLVERKGVEILLNAFADVAEEYPHAILTYIGSGPLEGVLRNNAESCGLADRVRLPGSVSSDLIDERIREARVLVLPSLFDGWGLVVNEALAAGVPVIVSDACGASDLVHRAADGIVVEADSQTALRNALARVLNSPEEYRPDAVLWRKRIGLPAVVTYFLECLRCGKSSKSEIPVPPWRLP